MNYAGNYAGNAGDGNQRRNWYTGSIRSTSLWLEKKSKMIRNEQMMNKGKTWKRSGLLVSNTVIWLV